MKYLKFSLTFIAVFFYLNLFSQSTRDVAGDGDYVINLELEGGYGYSRSEIVNNTLENAKIDDYLANAAFGLNLTKRLGYTTKVSLGASYNELISSIDRESFSAIQFPLRFYKIFASKGKLSVHTEKGRKIKTPYGFTLTVGGFVAQGMKKAIFSGKEQSPFDDKIAFGVSAGIGYSVRNFSLILEARHDLTEFTYLFSNNRGRTNISLRFSFGFLDI